MLNEPLAVLGEDRGHPDGIVHGQAHKPAKEHVVLNLLHEHVLGAHAVKRLQLHGAQQLLSCNALATAFEVGLIFMMPELSTARGCTAELELSMRRYFSSMLRMSGSQGQNHRRWNDP